MHQGLISTRIEGNISYETGPNAILLSDSFVHNGNFSNLTEFPILQMQYRQGMLLPNHPNNTGVKAVIMSDANQLKAQIKYIQRGHYGLLSESELIESGVSPDMARDMMKVKSKFAFGAIKSADELVETIEISKQYTDIRNGVQVRRIERNKFEFLYRDRTVVIDLNLSNDENYSFPYTLDYHNIPREYFSVVHSGEGDGWDMYRPSMSSILLFQGKIYLIDAPPNITFILEKLGIDISEVHGLFHTHIHDDHFAGLPNLILSGYRIKYFATPMVRASASKKLAALLSMDESCLSDFFDVHDLQLDQWNNCNGLDVRPLYSPHPVDNNCFIFRAQDKSGMKTYAHLADLSSFTVLDGMIGSEENDLSETFINKVKADYLVNVDVKKIDIGGGLIHGEATDFIDDKSNKILMAHTARTLTNSEKEIGSTAPFGSMETLIKSDQDYLRREAFYLLRSIFPSVPVNHLDGLLIAPIVLINPGSIILQKNNSVDYIDMILTGVVEYIHGETQKNFTLSCGSLIGETALFAKKMVGTWRARSHVKIMRISTQMMHSLLEGNQLYSDFEEKTEIISYLMTTRLFGEKLSFVLLMKIATAIKIQSLKAEETLNANIKNTLFLVKSGGLIRSDNHIIRKGEIVGEENYFDDIVIDSNYRVNENTELYVLTDGSLKDIPIVYWKLLEMVKK